MDTNAGSRDDGDIRGDESPEAPHRDMKAWLMALGVVEIGGACLMGLMTVLTGIVAMFPPKLAAAGTASPDPRGIWMGVLTYVVLALVWGVLGVGTFRARRTARTVSLAISWMWLVSGAVTLLVMLFMPPMPPPPAPAGQQPLSPGMWRIFLQITMIFIGFFMVVIPGVLVAFLRGRSVRRTCEVLDPHPSWADACPMPVLIVSFYTGLAGLMFPALSLHNFVMPFFGTILSGAAGAAVLLPLSLVMLWTSRGLFRLDPRAWTVAVSMAFLWPLSSIITFSRVEYSQMYVLMGLSEVEIQRVVQAGFGGGMVRMTWIGCGFYLGFLAYLRKHFTEMRPSI